jgi:hypothetical protein
MQRLCIAFSTPRYSIALTRSWLSNSMCTNFEAPIQLRRANAPKRIDQGEMHCRPPRCGALAPLRLSAFCYSM